MSFTLPELPYAHDALQPFMSKETLEFHHDKHHQAYVTAGNNLLKDSGLEGKSLEEVVKESYGKNAGLFNNAGVGEAARPGLRGSARNLAVSARKASMVVARSWAWRPTSVADW